jgi:toxin YoeB
MAKRKVVWSARAKYDLLDLLEFYYQRNGTMTYSRKLNSSLRKSIKRLEKNTELGFKTDIKNVRNIIEGDYSIFYELKFNLIKILTIWDNRQDPDELTL